MIEEAHELYAVAPEEFVARRNALVRELKADGRGEDAKAVATLRRPRLSEYALNAAVRADDALGPRFATAVAEATAAQSAAIGGGGADAMRTATRELRAATTALIEAAVQQLVQQGAGGDQRDEIEQLLRSLANRPGVELLRAGLVGSSVVDPDDLFAGAPEPPELPARPARATAGSTTRSRGRTTAPTAPAGKAAPAAPVAPAEKSARAPSTKAPSTTAVPSRQRAFDARAARAEAAHRRQLQADRARARTALRAAEREEAAASDALDAARRVQAKAEDRLEEARASLDTATAALQAIEDELGDT